MRAALILLVACKPDSAADRAAASADACAALVTPADVLKACGAPAVIEKTSGEGMTTQAGQLRLDHLCYRDITFDKDYDRQLGFVVNRMNPGGDGSHGDFLAGRDLLKKAGHELREIDSKTYLVTIAVDDRPTKEVHGAHGDLRFHLSARGRPGKAWYCSDDGMVELGRLIASRVSSLEH